MPSRYYDEKGKFYTDVITKDPIAAVLQTTFHKIEGTVYARPTKRLKDEINISDQFIAVSDATVYDLSGQVVQQCKFMLVNRDQLLWMIPLDDQGDGRRNSTIEGTQP